MAVKARITAIKASAAQDSIVERVSTSRVHVEASNDLLHVEVIARADGRMQIEVRDAQGRIMQFLSLTSEGRRQLPGSIVDGQGMAL